MRIEHDRSYVSKDFILVRAGHAGRISTRFEHHDTVEILQGGLIGELAVERFKREHYHDEIEAREIKLGVGYFMVRDEIDLPIEFLVFAGDYLEIPARRFHLFEPIWTPMDPVFSATRYFNQPHWEPHYRHEHSQS